MERFVVMGEDFIGQVRLRYYACEGFSPNIGEPLASPSFGRCDARGISLKATRLICCRPFDAYKDTSTYNLNGIDYALVRSEVVNRKPAI